MLESYKVVFYGRENGAIGRCYPLPPVLVYANNEDDARDRGFDRLTGKFEINKLCCCKKENEKMKKFNVYYLGKLYDTVYYADNMTCGDVKNSLVNHDNYPTEIQVVG